MIHRGLFFGVLGATVLTACGPTEMTPAGPLPPNFHVVGDGRVYRSAQPFPEEITAVAVTYGIRTVLNLRGSNPGKDWYDAEAAACAELGLTLVNIPMSAESLPPADVLREMVNTLQTAQYPMLIHCQGGADRSGAVAAIYRILILGEDKSAAMSELSPEFLHFRAFTPCMDTLVEMFELTPGWLDYYATVVDQTACAP